MHFLTHPPPRLFSSQVMHRLAYDKHGGGYLYSDSVVRRPFEPVSHDHDSTSVLHVDRLESQMSLDTYG